MVGIDRGKCELYKLCIMYCIYNFFNLNFRLIGYDEMCNFYIMYYSNVDRLEYFGGDCGEQDYLDIFEYFLSGFDIFLVYSFNFKLLLDLVISFVFSIVIVRSFVVIFRE